MTTKIRLLAALAICAPSSWQMCFAAGIQNHQPVSSMPSWDWHQWDLATATSISQWAKTDLNKLMIDVDILQLAERPKFSLDPEPTEGLTVYGSWEGPIAPYSCDELGERMETKKQLLRELIAHLNPVISDNAMPEVGEIEDLADRIREVWPSDINEPSLVREMTWMIPSEALFDDQDHLYFLPADLILPWRLVPDRLDLTALTLYGHPLTGDHVKNLYAMYNASITGVDHFGKSRIRFTIHVSPLQACQLKEAFEASVLLSFARIAYVTLPDHLDTFERHPLLQGLFTHCEDTPQVVVSPDEWIKGPVEFEGWSNLTSIAVGSDLPRFARESHPWSSTIKWMTPDPSFGSISNTQFKMPCKPAPKKKEWVEVSRTRELIVHAKPLQL